MASPERFGLYVVVELWALSVRESIQRQIYITIKGKRFVGSLSRQASLVKFFEGSSCVVISRLHSSTCTTHVMTVYHFGGSSRIRSTSPYKHQVCRSTIQTALIPLSTGSSKLRCALQLLSRKGVHYGSQTSYFGFGTCTSG